MNNPERPYVRVHPDDLDRLGRERDEAEARGYERGVRDAAEEIEKIAAIFDHPSVYMGGPSNQAKRRAKEIAAAILALLEPTLQEQSK